MKLHPQFLVAVALAVVAMTAPLSAQDTPIKHHRYHHYQIIDPGTFGGPQGFLSFVGGLPRAGILNNRGTLTGSADTLTVDPYCLDNPDCYAIHALQWRNGVTSDLGVLPGGLTSQVNWISASGLMTGVSDNGQPDPLSGGALPQIHGILWQHGSMTDLGTLPEGGYFSFANAVNSRGEVVGLAQNTVPDANAMLTGYGYQTRAFYWKNGVMQDLGTLGTGTDAIAGLINDRGEVIGWSFNSPNPNLDPLCFGFALTTGSFIWDQKNGMRDLGGLGGTSCTLPFDLNSKGQVVGGSDVPGEFQHPFVWDAATGMTDLGTPDGGYGQADAINEHGDVVGLGEANGGLLDAILWRKTGGKWRMTDLGTLSGCSGATSVNAYVQVVGSDCAGIAFFSEDGGPIVDLNTLVPPNSGLQLFEAQQINDRGEIAVEGPDASGDNHAVLLIPCDENHPDIKGCDYDTIDAETAAARFSPTPVIQSPATPSLRGRAPRMFNRFRSPGVRFTPVLRTPTPEAKPALSAKIVTDYLEADHRLGHEPFGQHVGYCGANSSGLTGYCIAYNFYSCLAKPSSACPKGQKAKDPGYFHCSDRFQKFVDLGRGCGF